MNQCNGFISFETNTVKLFETWFDKMNCNIVSGKRIGSYYIKCREFFKHDGDITKMNIFSIILI